MLKVLTKFYFWMKLVVTWHRVRTQCVALVSLCRRRGCLFLFSLLLNYKPKSEKIFLCLESFSFRFNLVWVCVGLYVFPFHFFFLSFFLLSFNYNICFLFVCFLVFAFYHSNISVMMKINNFLFYFVVKIITLIAI